MNQPTSTDRNAYDHPECDNQNCAAKGQGRMAQRHGHSYPICRVCGHPLVMVKAQAQPEAPVPPTPPAPTPARTRTPRPRVDPMRGGYWTRTW